VGAGKSPGSGTSPSVARYASLKFAVVPTSKDARCAFVPCHWPTLRLPDHPLPARACTREGFVLPHPSTHHPPHKLSWSSVFGPTSGTRRRGSGMQDTPPPSSRDAISLTRCHPLRSKSGRKQATLTDMFTTPKQPAAQSLGKQQAAATSANRGTSWPANLTTKMGSASPSCHQPVSVDSSASANALRLLRDPLPATPASAAPTPTSEFISLSLSPSLSPS
jgi:hypothetical protein